MCRAIENQFAFVAEAERCHAAHEILSAQGADDPARQSTVWTARLKTPPKP